MTSVTKDISERFSKLRELSEHLGKKSSKLSEALELNDWLINKLKDLTEQSKSDMLSKQDVIDKLEDLLCVVEVEDEEEE